MYVEDNIKKNYRNAALHLLLQIHLKLIIKKIELHLYFVKGMASGAGPTNMAMMVDLIPGNMRERTFISMQSAVACG